MKYLSPKSVLVTSCWMWSVFLAFVVGTQVPLRISIVRQSPKKVAPAANDSFSAKVEVPVVDVSEVTQVPISLNLPVDNNPPSVNAPPIPLPPLPSDEKPTPAPPAFSPLVETPPSPRPKYPKHSIEPPLTVPEPTSPSSTGLPPEPSVGVFVYNGQHYQSVTIGDLLTSLKRLAAEKADCEKVIVETTAALKTQLNAAHQELEPVDDKSDVSKSPGPVPPTSIDELVSNLKKAKANKRELATVEKRTKQTARAMVEMIQKEALSLGVMDVEPLPPPPPAQ